MKNFFEKNSLLFIDENGNNIVIPRVQGEKNHEEAYTRVSTIYPNLMKDYEQDISISGGMILASYLASKKIIVVWPSSLENSDYLIVTFPQRITNIQCEQLQQFLKEQKIYDKHTVLATISSYYGNENETFFEILCDNGIDAKTKINNYIKLQRKLNEMSTPTTEDIRKTNQV